MPNLVHLSCKITVNINQHGAFNAYPRSKKTTDNKQMYSKYKASLITDKYLSIGHTNANVEVRLLSQSGEGKHFQICMWYSSALTGTI